MNNLGEGGRTEPVLANLWEYNCARTVKFFILEEDMNWFSKWHNIDPFCGKCTMGVGGQERMEDMRKAITMIQWNEYRFTSILTPSLKFLKWDILGFLFISIYSRESYIYIPWDMFKVFLKGNQSLDMAIKGRMDELTLHTHTDAIKVCQEFSNGEWHGCKMMNPRWGGQRACWRETKVAGFVKVWTLGEMWID